MLPMGSVFMPASLVRPASAVIHLSVEAKSYVVDFPNSRRKLANRTCRKPDFRVQYKLAEKYSSF
jgi:hypothetical protein